MSNNIDIVAKIIKKMMDKGLIKSVEQPPEGKTINEANIEIVCKAINNVYYAMHYSDISNMSGEERQARIKELSQDLELSSSNKSI